MKRKLLLAALPLGLALPFLWGGRSRAPSPRHIAETPNVERLLGYHLLQPTYLPRGMVAGGGGFRQGALRVLCDYSNDVDTMIIAQEKRTVERDQYNHSRFQGNPLPVNEYEGSMSMGSLGERRLMFYTPEMTVVLSSSTLTGEELLSVARSMR
jgi:hypothetical protein